MSEYAVPAMLTLSAIALVTALLGLSGWLSSMTGGNDPKVAYWSKMFAGVSYIALGLDGVIASAFIDENRLFTYIIAWAFVIMGGYVFRSGWRLRAKTLSSK